MNYGNDHFNDNRKNNRLTDLHICHIQINSLVQSCHYFLNTVVILSPLFKVAIFI